MQFLQKVNLKYVLAILLIALWPVFVSMFYQNKIDNQFWIKQVAQLDKEMSQLSWDIDEISADILIIKEQLSLKESTRTKRKLDYDQKKSKKDNITTAVYYLNKSLWISNQTWTIN